MKSRASIHAPQSAGQDLRTLRTTLPYLWPKDSFGLKARVVIALLLLAAGKGTNVVVPLFYKDAVDALSLEGEALLAIPLTLLLAYGATRLLALVFVELQHAVFVRVTQRAIRVVALKTFRHLHQLSLAFHLDRQTGGLSRAIERGTKGIEFLMRFMLFSVGPTLLEIALVVAVLWTLYNAWFALATLVTVGGFVVWTLVVTEWRIKFRRRMNETDQEATTKAIDSLINYETVKYFNNEEHEAQRFDRSLMAYEEAAVQSRSSLSLLNIGQGAFVSAGVTVIMVMAASGVVDGSMTVGDFVLVNTYLIQLFLPLNFLGFVYREIKRSLADLEAMFGLLESQPDISDTPDASPLPVGRGSVAFESVGFSYDGRRQVLEDVSFTIPAGGTVAVVGQSGAGKSTLSRLLFRFYDVTEGRITIDGQDLRKATQASVRAAIGVVPQDTVLFNDTVYYNIAYGRPEASQEDVEKAARMAHIHDFVAGLPDGYETRVGERGLKLSGGEKQRVAIARALLKDPAILLFDEATSSLDTQTEKTIQANLEEVARDRTTLIIAHRLSTVIHADEIIVLKAGRIIERGTHGDLLRAKGAYFRMWRRQQEVMQAQQVLNTVEEDAAL
ncbi:ABC transporter ATP-binding protein/permease [Magnetospira sp. QH-2]|uniref:ABCB family ABC transporter ATP-binding protein/permease n=1 Tax=Magnetospira sp. (strain QH-2) TaxID=1288970 RepID=UPI0003E8139B|nr:ABC transporter ATP-binding protein/permease [Magnetospira sp. QH-2]CCQ73517.1 ABC-type transport system involved in Fe-S cluster assembly, permease and ATPase components [Magnetospira sp. QH-2]